LKRKAEDAKRKAQELRSVAEAKAAAAMKAVKEANDKVASTGGAEAQAQQVIAQETQKMNAQADAVKEARNKASSRVVISDGAIIPINESTIEFTAGVLGGTAALVLGGGPVLAVVAAAAANYLSRKDDLGEINELVQGISRASLETFNWFAKLDTKYSLVGKLQETLEDAINKLKTSGGESAETIASIEKTVSQTTKQLQELAKETDFLEGTKQALGAVGDVIETSVDKAASVNKEYKLTERATGAVKKAIDKAQSVE
jgi:chromosome segregation ATPase